jgi:hypothetical protein
LLVGVYEYHFAAVALEHEVTILLPSIAATEVIPAVITVAEIHGFSTIGASVSLNEKPVEVHLLSHAI